MKKFRQSFLYIHFHFLIHLYQFTIVVGSKNFIISQFSQELSWACKDFCKVCHSKTVGQKNLKIGFIEASKPLLTGKTTSLSQNLDDPLNQLPNRKI